MLPTEQELCFLTPRSNFLSSHSAVWITASQIAFFWLCGHTHTPDNKQLRLWLSWQGEGGNKLQNSETSVLWELGFHQQSLPHDYGSSWGHGETLLTNLGFGSCPATLTGKSALLQAWLVPTAAANLLFVPFAWKCGDSLAWLSQQRGKEGWRHRVSITSSAVGLFSTENVRNLSHRISARVTDCKRQPRGNAGSLLYPHPSKIFTDAWLPTAWAVSTKPPASSTTAGDPQAPNARGTQGLTPTHHERNWRNLTVPADWAPCHYSKQINPMTNPLMPPIVHFPFNYKAELISKREGDQLCHLGCQGTFKHRGSFQ